MELFWDPEDISPNYIWSFSEFLDQYNELYEWLVQIQLKLYSHSNPPDTRLQIDQQNILQRHQYRLKLFAFQGEKVAERFSLSKEEIFWRIRYLTNKWDQLKNIFAPCRGYIQDTVIEVDLAQEETFLRNWLDAMEDQIKPITCKLPKGCSLNTLKERYKDNQILLKDVKAHGPILKNIIRQYEKQTKHSSKIAQNSFGGSAIQPNVAKEEVNKLQGFSIVPRKIKGLEKKWHQIYLRSLEWHYHLESVIRNFKIQDHICKVSDSDDEPVSKCRRISAPTNSCELPCNKLYSSGWSDYECSSSETGSYIEDDYVMTNSDVDGKQPTISNKSNFSPKTNVQLFAWHMNEESTNDSRTASEMNSFVVCNSAKSSENNYNESTSDNSKCSYNSNIINPNSSNLSQISKLTDKTMETPNCGVFDYKHDSDSESNKNDILISSLHSNNEVEYIFDKTKDTKVNKFSCKKVKNKDVYEDEEQEQKNLQQIIDSAVLDHDWLDGNITFTDSDESVVDKAEPFHIDKKIVFEGSEEKRKILSTENVPCNKKFIHQLVKDAENLVREPTKFQGLSTQKQHVEPSEKLTEGKQCQINNWLNSQCTISRSVTQLDAKNNNMQDSCDASGELTTGESDFESKESDYEGCDTSLATEKGNEEILHCASNASSATEFHFDVVKQKVIRGKKRHADRPRSANILFENDDRLQSWDTSKYVFSSSETALDRMGKLNLKQRISCEALYSVIPNHNEPVVNLNKNVLQASPSSLTLGNNCRRRRIKLRKKFNQSLNMKMDSDLDETLCKPGRKSEGKCLNNYSPFHTPTKIISSDSDNISCCSKFSKTFSPSGKSCLSRIVMTSSTEKFHSDSSMVSVDFPLCLEARKVISQPVENIAPSSGSNFQSHRMNLSDQETTTQPEDASSLSEQAWDSYQEYKYLSEPYSEDVDVDAERRLIEFGDDYSKYIDSDESSFYNIPNRRRRSSLQRRVRNICSNISDSDSDIENIQKDIEESLYKLSSMEKSLNEQLNCISVGFNWDEFITTARSNAKYLQDIIKLNSEDKNPKLDINIIYSIVNKWELLEAKAREKQLQSVQVTRLQWQLKSIRMTMENILNSCSAYVLDFNFESFSQISINLDKINSLINECDGLKSDISAVNTQIHRYSSEIALSINPLKDEMTELYRMWDETHRRVQSEHSRMEQIEATFRAWEEQKVELSRALKQDSDALKVVNVAVDSGKLTESVTASVRDVAKLLNERRKYSFVVKNKDQFVSQDIYQRTHELRKKEDRLSDSGTSGYESCSSDDLSERERRLAYLKRLAKDLEASLAPGCSAWKEINLTLDQAEKELKDLQDHCRYLILKTTETFEPSSKFFCFSSNSKRRILAREGKNISRNTRREKRMKILGSRRDWMWRVARAAVPFQIALMLLVCVACLLEPNCCDSVNTFNLSFTPQLRFVHGSPPI